MIDKKTCLNERIKITVTIIYLDKIFVSIIFKNACFCVLKSPA